MRRIMRAHRSTFGHGGRPGQAELARHLRQDELNSRSLAGFAIEMQPAAQTIRNDGVDDVQAEAGAASISARREERIERPVPDIEAHAAAIIGKDDFDIVRPGCLHLDLDGTSLAVGKRMRDRVEEEDRQHLSVWSGIAVNREIGLAFDVEDQSGERQARPIGAVS